MKAIQLAEPKQFRVIDVPEPAAPGPGEAVVKVLRVGICGTDYSGYLGKMPFFSYPRIPGHELGVEVLAVGPDVANVKVGDRAAVEPYINCQKCYSCARGHTNCCENHQTLGVHCDGGLRPLFTIPARKLHVSTKLTFDQLALVETLGIGLHAINRAQPRADETVLVIGAGPIGLSVIEFAKLAGSRVIVMDLNEQRLRFAREKMGVTETITAKGLDADIATLTELTAGKLGNVVVDATGSVKSMVAAMNFVGFVGRLVWVGITQDELSFTQPIMHRREMTLLASRNALPHEFTRIIRLIEGGMLDTRPWITHRAPFEAMIDQFTSWLKPETGVVKAMVEVNEGISLMPSYARYRLAEFSRVGPTSALGALSEAHATDVYAAQRSDAVIAWSESIRVLQVTANELIQRYPQSSEWHLLLEYPIPRRAKRIDAVLLAAGIIFVLEFKTGENDLTAADRRQVEDYALDLRDFHVSSRGRIVIPILIAPRLNLRPHIPDRLPSDPVQSVHLLGNSSMAEFLVAAFQHHHLPGMSLINVEAWDASEYRPVPTVVEAAARLYASHKVRDIAHSHAGIENLTRTADAVLEVVDECRRLNEKAVCFITGVPGAGKTLAGLNIVHSAELHQDRDSLGVFLSGNGPLVKVLTEALARDRAIRLGETRERSRTKVSTFIQNVHQFLSAHTAPSAPLPPDRVVVFDEAQRAWDRAQSLRKFKRDESEPSQMLRILDRHSDWAVLVALVGGGQEINRGEAGLPEWGRAIKQLPHWKAFISEELATGRDTCLFPEGDVISDVTTNSSFHLSVCLRAYRAEHLAAWVDATLDGDSSTARQIHRSLNDYPLFLTRSLENARRWLREKRRGNRRCGLIASSGARRLRPFGLDGSVKLDAPNWFLQPPEDIRSSSFLELVATEFAIQGLELDWTGVCWDADFRREGDKWLYHRFEGTRWKRVADLNRRRYTLNKYRVLLTRAREGMVIWVPAGSSEDSTRPPSYYDDTAEYLRTCGVRLLDSG